MTGALALPEPLADCCQNPPPTKSVRTRIGHTEGIRTLAIDPHCQYLVSGSEDKTLKIWHFESGELRQTLLGHEQTVRTLAIHPNGKTIVSGSDDKTIKFWRII